MRETITFANGGVNTLSGIEEELFAEINKYSNDVLKTMLQDPDQFNSLDINYRPPQVHRLYKPGNEYRLSLHKIFLYEGDIQDCLYHKHDYPTAIKILSGTYFMKSGYSETDQEPQTACSSYYTDGSIYLMASPDQRHAVNPIDGPSYSIMITGPMFHRPKTNNPNKKLQALSADAKQQLIQEFLAIL